MSGTNKFLIYVILAIVAFIAVVSILYLTSETTKYAQVTTTQKTPLIFISTQPLSQQDPQFISHMQSKYNIIETGPQNFSSLLSSPIIIIVVNMSTVNPISGLIEGVLKNESINMSVFKIGSGLYFDNLWSKHQEVYVLLNMNSTETTNALNTFFGQPQVSVPNLLTAKSDTVFSGKDPLLDGISVPNFQCPYGCPLDALTPLILKHPLDYYANFSYAFYFSDDGFFSGGGASLPTNVGFCTPPTPGTCVGVYVGAPVFLGPQGLVTPFLGLFNVNVSTTLGIDKGVEGTVTEDSFFISDFSFSPTSINSTNETITYLFTPLSQLIRDGVKMYSNPLYPLPFFDWVYGVYPLVSVNSTIGNVSGLTRTNYTNLFFPMNLTAPEVFTNSSGTWNFLEWSIYEEIGNETYYQTFNESTIPFYVQGPIQATAVYTYQAPPKPGSISGVVKYAYSRYNSYLNISGLGPAISGVHVLFYNNGSLAANATTNIYGQYSTSILPEGCYNVSLQFPLYYENGIYIYPEYWPVCVYGNVYNYNLYEFGQPGMAVSSPAGFQPIIPKNQNVTLFAHLYWPDGKPVTNFSVYTSLNSSAGTLNSSITNSSGVATIGWNSGSKLGFYYLNFTSYLAHYPVYYTVPANIVSINLSRENATVHAFNDSNISVPFNLTYPGSVYSAPIPAILSANLSLPSLPPGITAKILRNPVPFYTQPVLLLYIKSSVKTGLYNINITATDNGPSYWKSPISSTYDMKLNVSTCSSGLGGISGTVLNLDGNPSAANVKISNTSKIVYNFNTTNGIFDTGYSLEPGQYNVSAYGIFGGNSPYYSAEAYVTRCAVYSLSQFTPRGAILVNVKLNGAPAYKANISLLRNSVTVARGTTSINGVYETPYDLLKGNYTVYTTYSTLNFTSLVKIYSGTLSNITVNI